MDEITNALKSLRMPGMAHYWTTMQETRQTESLSLRDGLQLLIQAELDNRTEPELPSGKKRTLPLSGLHQRGHL